MTDVGTIASGITALKTAFEIAKGIKDLSDRTAIQGQIGELQAQILAAQGAALNAQANGRTLIDEVGALEKEVARLKTWDAEPLHPERRRIACRPGFRGQLPAIW